jgi:uncharacterized protein YecT (DUF1311 family)
VAPDRDTRPRPVRAALAALAIALAWPSAGGAGSAPPCALETRPAARAACIGHEADLALNRIDALLARFAGGPVASAGEGPPALEGATAAGQAAWRRRMERACRRAGAGDRAGARDAVARQHCRLARAGARLRALRRLVAQTHAARGLPPPPWLAPPGSVKLLVPLPRRAPRGGARPYLELRPPPGRPPP